MSELKVYHCNEWHNEYTEFYIKYDVDAAIDEPKTAHHKERHEYIKMIADLRKSGMRIVTSYTDRDGNRWATYRLKEAV